MNNSSNNQPQDFETGKVKLPLFFVSTGVTIIFSIIATVVMYKVLASSVYSENEVWPLMLPVYFALFSLVTIIVFGISVFISNFIKHPFRSILIPSIISLLVLMVWLTNQNYDNQIGALPIVVTSLVPPIYFLFINKFSRTLASKKTIILFFFVALFSSCILLIELLIPNYCLNKCLDINKSSRNTLNSIRQILPPDSLPGYTISYSEADDNLISGASIEYSKFTENNKEIHHSVSIQIEKGGGPIGNGEEIDLDGVKAIEACNSSSSDNTSWNCDITWKKDGYRTQITGWILSPKPINTNNSIMQDMLALEEKIARIVANNSSLMTNQ